MLKWFTKPRVGDTWIRKPEEKSGLESPWAYKRRTLDNPTITAQILDVQDGWVRYSRPPSEDDDTGIREVLVRDFLEVYKLLKGANDKKNH